MKGGTITRGRPGDRSAESEFAPPRKGLRKESKTEYPKAAEALARERGRLLFASKKPRRKKAPRGLKRGPRGVYSSGAATGNRGENGGRIDRCPVSSRGRPHREKKLHRPTATSDSLSPISDLRESGRRSGT